MKKHVAVERLDNGDKFMYTRCSCGCGEDDKDPTLFSDGTVGFRVLCESDDEEECRAAVEAAYDAEGRDPVAEYLAKMAEDLRGLV